MFLKTEREKNKIR